MKGWLRPAYLWKGLGLVLGGSTDENHTNLTEHTVFQVHEAAAILAYEGQWLEKYKEGFMARKLSCMGNKQ